jgi:DNA-binding MarR family transcriptional regulator
MDYNKLTDEHMKDMFLRKPLLKKANDMSKGEIGALLYLGRENNNALAGEISARMKITSGRMASILKSLDKKGYISKRKGKEDCRQTIVSITVEGQDFLEKDRKLIFSSIRNLLVFLGEEDAKNYVRINKRLVEKFDKEKEYYNG